MISVAPLLPHNDNKITGLQSQSDKTQITDALMTRTELFLLKIYPMQEVTMKIKIELTEEDLKKMVMEKLEDSLGSLPFNPKAVQILVKTKQNYKAEWELGSFKAVYEVV